MDLEKEQRSVVAEIERVEREMASLDAWEARFDELASRQEKLTELTEWLGYLQEVWPPGRAQPFDDLLWRLARVSSLQADLAGEPETGADLRTADWELEAFALWLEAQQSLAENSSVEVTARRLTISEEPGRPILFGANDREAICGTKGFRSLEKLCNRLHLELELMDDLAELEWNFDGTFHELSPLMCHFAVEVRRKRAGV